MDDLDQSEQEIFDDAFRFMEFHYERVYFCGCNTSNKPFYLPQHLNEKLMKILNPSEFEIFSAELTKISRWNYFEKLYLSFFSFLYSPFVIYRSFDVFFLIHLGCSCLRLLSFKKS